MRLVVEIDADNDAFAEDFAGELRRVLSVVASRAAAAQPGDDGGVMDVNGNTCARWSLEQ